MCGIAGWAGALRPDAAEAGVRRMTRSLARRGPDGEGLQCVSGLVLGHRRLSIFDLSDLGRQPMSTPDERVSVVFNGAIYNFRELRQELLSRGYSFRSQTDTEVLLHGYHAWGMDALLERIRGMFAIGLWDSERRTLWLVRDRLGVKPLFFTEAPGGELIFASTARALREAGLAQEVDPDAVLEFLQRGYISEERSIWRGVRKLAAGHVLEWRDRQIRSVRAYWRMPEPGSASPISFGDAVEETERLLLEAVRRRLDADVPVGALLSGGIDSGLVCWAIAQLGGDIQAFTVGAPGDASDESDDASRVARRLGIRHRIIPVTGQEAPAVEELVEAYGEPFACASALGMLRVSRAVRQHATVLLTGDGGDDVFLGYPEHRACQVAQRLARRTPGFAGGLLRGAAGLLPASGPARRARTLLWLASRGIAGWQRTQDRFGYYRQHHLLGERLAGRAVPELTVEDSLAGGRQLLENFLAYDRRLRFPGEYMTKVDGGAMHHALEARSPFLDQRIWEFAGALPVELHLRGGELKAILRALARRHLGEETATGAKRGFTIPVGRWMAGPLLERAAVDLLDSELGRQRWIQPAAVVRQLRATAGGEAPLPLWYLWVFEHWLRRERQTGLSPVPEQEHSTR